VNLIKIVNFHYDLIMPNSDCTVILQKKEGYINIYGHILYIIIYWCLRECYVLRLLCFFSVLVFWNLEMR